MVQYECSCVLTKYLTNRIKSSFEKFNLSDTLQICFSQKKLEIFKKKMKIENFKRIQIKRKTQECYKQMYNKTL